MMDRRSLLVGFVALLGSCPTLSGNRGEVSGRKQTMIESNVADQVFVEHNASALPSPDDPPALGVTNAGLYQFTEAAGEWVPFPLTRVLDVTDDGAVTLGTRTDPLGAVEARAIDGVPRARARAVSGAGTKDDPFVLPEDLLEDVETSMAFGPGWFESAGLTTAADTGFDETSLYLPGEGVRTTTLQHSADEPSTPTVHFRGSGGNFGGIRDMTVYGAGEGTAGSGSAPIVRSDGEIIDHQFENVIVRYGGGDVLHLDHSASGTRVQNAWLENAPGWALYLGGGSRPKVNGVHTAGTEGGVKMEGTGGNFSDLTLTYLRGHTGVVTTSTGNNFSNVVVRYQVDRGFEIYGAHTTISNVFVEEANRDAFLVSGTTAVSNAIARNFGADGGSLFRVLADGTSVSNVWGARTDPGYGNRLLTLDANRCLVDGIGGDPSEDWEVRIQPGATENVIDGLRGVSVDSITDLGTRTLVNGWGTNDGAPQATGEWHGHAEYAGQMGATIWDTSTPSSTPFEVSPAGDWVEIGA